MRRVPTSIVLSASPSSQVLPLKRINGLRHPGVVLCEDFLTPRGLTATALAQAIGVAPVLLHSFIEGWNPVTSGDLASKLGSFFGVHPDWWLELQRRWDREVVGDDVVGGLSGIVPFKRAS